MERTADACHMTNACHVQLAVAAIGCDDISAMSSSAKSVADETGKSLLEFMDWLDPLEFPTRPQILIMECVAALMKERSVVSEKGTAVVSSFLLGRTYGMFCRLVSFGDAVTSMWEFVDRCKTKTSGSEALHGLVDSCFDTC